MTNDDNRNTRQPKEMRQERLKAALRENLKRRKSQSRGRAGVSIVTPDDDARSRRETGSSSGNED